MVNRLTRGLWLPIIVAGALSAGRAKDLSEYRLGDQITEDIVTPVPLMVVDPIATKALKDKEEYRIPVIFRYHANTLATVEANLRDAFSQARSNFLFLVEDSFRRPQLDDRQMDSELFQRVIDTFKRRSKGFPLSDEMAREWASGNTVLPEQIALSARIHQAMEGLIRYDNLTNAPKLGSLVTLVPMKQAGEPVTLEDVKTRGVTEFRTNLLTLSRARIALLEKFATEESDMAKFAARCLRENCFVESELTRAARARHTEPLLVADNFQAGQVIARQGQLLDEKIMAALSQLQEKTAAGRLAAEASHEREIAAQIRASNRWLVVGLVAAGGVLVLVLSVLALRRRREPMMQSVALSSANAIPLIGTTPEENAAPATTDSWQQRALTAEQKVEQAHAAIRAGVMAQLKEKLVSNLASQREEMLGAQQSAAAELAELDQRLNELHAPLQERLRVYEARMADLEKALAAKGEENRELIKAKIEMTRKQLETERAKNDLQFN